MNETQTSVSSFLVTEPLKDRITSAKVKFPVFLAENNLQMATADNVSRLFKSTFPDSQIAKKYSCGRTKSSAILNDTLAADLKEKLVDNLKQTPLSIATDGSKDIGLEKMNPMTVKFFDINSRKIKHRFLDMCTTHGGTAGEIFQKMNNVIVQNQINWNHCIDLSVGNTAVNMGITNGLEARFCTKMKQFMLWAAHVILFITLV